MIRQIRQGDVLLVRRTAPSESTRIDSPGLRVPGERTGHAHVLPAEVHEVAGGRRLLHVARTTPITHEEHGAIPVPPGWWEPILQHEWSPSRRPQARMRFD